MEETARQPEIASGKAPMGNTRREHRPRILLADDHTLLGAAFQKLLEPRYNVLGIVADGQELLSAAREHKPDLILLDISMPLLNGLDAARQLKQALPHCKLIFLTMNNSPDMAAEAFRIGGSGYLLKTSAAVELFQAIDQVLEGKNYVTPLVTREMVESLLKYHETGRQDTKISHRQRAVIQLLAEGKTMKDAARILNISARTVAYHKYRTMTQLNLKTNADLVQYAIREGLVSV